MGNGYKVKKELGKGGFGKVILVEKENIYYAIKKISIKHLKKEEKNMYKNEIKILSKLESEFIIKYYNFKEDKDYLNIIMEFGGDDNLKTFIQKHKFQNKYIEENIIKKIIIQICLGLKEIHENKIIHRDLTPDNIFINEDNQIKIGDFGISKQLEANNLYAKTQIGKQHYLAPEVEKGEKYDYRIDIYSLGCIIYELFTLNEYYIDKIDNKDCKINLEIYDKKWQELIELLMKKDFHDRPNIEGILSNEKYFKKSYIAKIEKNINMIKNNEITLVLNIGYENKLKDKKIYFLDNSPKHEYLKELNEYNTSLYIDNIKSKYNKYFIPKYTGEIKIKIKFNCFIQNISNMFYLCENLISIDFSSFNTRNIMYMENMFYNCTNLKEIKINEIFHKKFTNHFPELESKIFYDYSIIFIGDCNIGSKTSFINRLINDTFNLHTLSTIGVYSLTKVFTSNNQKNIRLTFWDTPGQYRYRGCLEKKKKNIDCIILGYDITNNSSFENIKDYWFQASKSISKTYLIYLVGNKLDLENKRKVSENIAKSYADENNLKYFEISCLTKIGIKEFLDDLIDELAADN